MGDIIINIDAYISAYNSSSTIPDISLFSTLYSTMNDILDGITIITNNQQVTEALLAEAFDNE